MASAAVQRRVCGQVVVVTGASDGIGERLAYRLAEAGARVVLVARREDKLTKVCDTIRESGGVAFWYAANLAKQEEVARVTEEILRDHERVDIFVSNAGRSIRRSVEYQASDHFHDFERLMALNYFGALRMILGVLEGMRKRRCGHIIHVSSFGVPMRQPRFAGYVASKCALDAALQSIAAEVRPHNVFTSSVYMPLVATKMVQSQGHSYDHFYLLSLDEACSLIEKAILTRDQEVMDVQARFINFLYFFLPVLVTALMSRIYMAETEKPPDHWSPDGRDAKEHASKQHKRSDRERASGKKHGLRALGNFLLVVHILDPVLEVVVYVLSPLLSALLAGPLLIRNVMRLCRFGLWCRFSALKRTLSKYASQGCVEDQHRSIWHILPSVVVMAAHAIMALVFASFNAFISVPTVAAGSGRVDGQVVDVDDLALRLDSRVDERLCTALFLTESTLPCLLSSSLHERQRETKVLRRLKTAPPRLRTAS